MFDYNRWYDEKESSFRQNKITILSPIIKLDNSLYSEDYFKFGTFFQNGHPIIEATRDEDALYLAFSYSNPNIYEWYGISNCEWVKKLKVSKYKFPNFELQWEKVFDKKSVQSISVNNKELALFDMNECEVFVLDKFTGEEKERSINLASSGQAEKQGLSIEFSNKTHHDIAFIDKNLVTMSHFNVLRIFDENFKEVSTLSFGQNYSLIDCFKNGGKMKSPQSDIANNRVYFASDNKLMALTSDGIKIVTQYDLPIHDITFNSKDESLLIHMAGEDDMEKIEILSIDFINKSLSQSEKQESQKLLTNFKKL
jgi:hypothetical protein